jgi:acyl carrier protein
VLDEFSIHDFKVVLGEIFTIDIQKLTDETDLSQYIKDSIDLGEVVAVLKSRHKVEPKDWNSFKTSTSVKEVFQNFIPIK